MANPTQQDIRDLIAALNNNTTAVNNNTGGNNPSGNNSSTSKRREIWGDYFDEKTSTGKKSWNDKQREKFLREREAGDKEASMKTLKRTTKMNVAATATNAITDGLGKAFDFAATVWKNNIKKREVSLNAAADLEKRAIQTYGQALTNVTAAQVGNLTSEVVDNAFTSLHSVMEGGKSFYLKGISDQLTIAKKNTEIANTNRDTVRSGIETATGMISDVASMLGPVGSIIGGVLGLVGKASSQALEIANIEAEYKLKLQEKTQELIETQVETWHKMVEGYEKIGLAVTKSFNKITRQNYEYGRSLFLSKDGLEKYSESFLDVNVRLASMGLKAEEYYKAQQTYINNSGGRNVMLSGNDIAGIGGLSKILGVDTGEIGGLVGAMNIFNTSISDGNQLIYTMSKNAAKMGLNATKYAKDLEKSLKLAEKYQFKGGVRGVMDMALWAQKVRFNMDSLSSVLEKMHTGNIEDVIKTSARLNVLGGNAALLSDPMSMLYNAYADPEQYAKNIQQMISGFGHFNKRTGETDFNINEQMRMEAMASALGISREEFFNMARQEKKAGQIKKTYGNKFGAKTDFVTQNATWKEGKGWVVKVKEGNDIVEKKLDDLSENSDELNNIFPEDKQDQLLDLVTDIRNYLSTEEEQAAGTASLEAKTVKGSYNTLYKNGRAMAEEQYAEINRHLNLYVEAVEASSDAAVKAQKLMNDMIGENGLELYKTLVSENIKEYEKMRDSLTEVNGALKVFLKEGYEGLKKYFQEGLEGGFVNGIQSEYDAKNIENNTVNEGRDAQERAKNLMRNYNLDPSKTYTYNDLLNELGSEAKLDKFLIEYAGNGEPDNDGIFDINRGNFWSAFNPNRWRTEYGWLKRRMYKRGATIKNGLPVDNDGELMLDDNLFEKKVNDLIISPKHGIFETDPEDTIIARKPGGSLDQSEERRNNSFGNNTLTINGTLKLDTGRQSIDLMEIMRNDPTALRELAKEVIIEGSRTIFGGKHQWAPNRYTFEN